MPHERTACKHTVGREHSTIPLVLERLAAQVRVVEEAVVEGRPVRQARRELALERLPEHAVVEVEEEVVEEEEEVEEEVVEEVEVEVPVAVART